MSAPSQGPSAGRLASSLAGAAASVGMAAAVMLGFAGPGAPAALRSAAWLAFAAALGIAVSGLLAALLGAWRLGSLRAVVMPLAVSTTILALAALGAMLRSVLLSPP